jgi:hypothetical protein
MFNWLRRIWPWYNTHEVNQMELPKLMTKADMATRWGVSRQVVKNWEDRHSNFPKPVMIVSNGQIPLYLESDVERYEQERGLVKVE